MKTADLAARRAAPMDSKRETLGAAAKSGEWFKRIDVAAKVGQTIVGPNLGCCTDKLLEILLALHSWIVSVNPSDNDEFDGFVGDLLGIPRGVVIAPAGCGKTQFLVGSVKVNPAGRVLVLTHTRAGVAVIRTRLLCRLLFARNAAGPQHCRSLARSAQCPKRATRQLDPAHNRR